jgi:DNA/RNA endonuclease YhcR with UshA esterase domain
MKNVIFEKGDRVVINDNSSNINGKTVTVTGNKSDYAGMVCVELDGCEYSIPLEHLIISPK